MRCASFVFFVPFVVPFENHKEHKVHKERYRPGWGATKTGGSSLAETGAPR